jgi:DNA-binding MarR family transcriptional regulator
MEICSILHNLEEKMDQYNSPEFTSLVEISRLANTLQTVMDMGMNDITSRQWLPLMILGRCEEAPNLNQLAEKCGITRQSAKQLVDKLVDKDLVRLEKDENDRRNSLVVITKKGRSWGKNNLERNVMFVQDLYSGISEKDIKTFAKVQQKLLAKLEMIKLGMAEEAINE